MNGGGLFETGAGGSAPKHVQQFAKQGYLRWDSLGEFLALAVSLEHMSEKYSNNRCKILGQCLDKATEKLLLENKSPTRKLGGIDNRGSHFYIAYYWAEALSNQDQDKELSNIFKKLYANFNSKEDLIIEELINAQGLKQDLDGYYLLDKDLVNRAMCPSVTLNKIIKEF